MWKQNGKSFGRRFLLLVLVFWCSSYLWSQDTSDGEKLKALTIWALNAQALIDDQAKSIQEKDVLIQNQASLINEQKKVIEDQQALNKDEQTLSESLITSLAAVEYERDIYRVSTLIGAVLLTVESVLWIAREVSR